MKVALRMAVCVAVLLALWPAVRWLDMLAMRELFRACEALGLINPGGSFWGQILGYNVPRHSDALHMLVRFLAAAAAFAPALAIVLALYHRLAFTGFRGRTTRCGGCAGKLKNLAEPRCPHCGRAI